MNANLWRPGYAQANDSLRFVSIHPSDDLNRYLVNSHAGMIDSSGLKDVMLKRETRELLRILAT